MDLFSRITNDTTDYGPEPYVTNIARQTLQNQYFRRTLWTGEHLQLTLMCIPQRGEIGLEVHPDDDQFLRIEQGQGLVFMGQNKDKLNVQTRVSSGDAIFIPAGTWHNVVNVGENALKLYSIYAPPHHPYGTIHKTKADADAEGD